MWIVIWYSCWLYCITQFCTFVLCVSFVHAIQCHYEGPSCYMYNVLSFSIFSVCFLFLVFTLFVFCLGIFLVWLFIHLMWCMSGFFPLFCNRWIKRYIVYFVIDILKIYYSIKRKGRFNAFDELLWYKITVVIIRMATKIIRYW